MCACARCSSQIRFTLKKKKAISNKTMQFACFKIFFMRYYVLDIRLCVCSLKKSIN